MNTLRESHKQLMFTNVFAYYIDDHNQKEIFEANQKDLEPACERLAYYLRRPVMKEHFLKNLRDIVDNSGYCKRRLKIMQEHIHEGFEKEWWSFITKSPIKSKQSKKIEPIYSTDIQQQCNEAIKYEADIAIRYGIANTHLK